MAVSRRGSEKTSLSAQSRSNTPYLINFYKQQKRAGKIAITAIALFLALILADAAYVWLRLPDAFGSAGQNLQGAVEALKRGDAAAARTKLVEAGRQTREARSLSNHPATFIAGYLPVIGTDVELANDFQEVLEDVGAAGEVALEAGDRFGALTGEELGATVFQDGRVQLERLQEIQPYIEEMNGLLDDALAEAQATPVPTFDRFATMRAEAITFLQEASDLTANGDLLMRSMPALLGADGPREYLLVFQSPSEARATGGLIGLYGILEARDGVVTLTHVGPFVDLLATLDVSSVTSLEEARALRRRYERALRTASNINVSPDFPAVSKKLKAIYERSSGRKIDGVFATDPVALAEFTKATGPLQVAGFDRPLGPENSVSALLLDAYVRLWDDPQELTRVLMGAVRAFYDRLASARLDAAKLMEAFAVNAASQHIKVYSDRPAEQSALSQLGISGSLGRFGDDAQLIYHNNLGQNKVDYYLNRKIDTEVTFTEGGDARVETIVKMNNGASADGPPPMVRSATRVVPNGVNLMELGAVLPKGATLGEWSVDGAPVTPKVGEEAGFPTASTKVRMPPGGSSEVRIVYEVPGATDLRSGGDFAFALHPHASTRTDTYSLTLIPPPGFVVRSSIGQRVGSGSIRLTDELDGGVELEIEIDAF